MPTGFFTEAAGHIVEMDLPLPDHMEDRVTKGYLKRVNADGAPWREQSEEDENTEDVESEEESRPPVNASKAEWVGYAVRTLGMDPDDAEAATKQDLIDLANQK